MLLVVFDVLGGIFVYTAMGLFYHVFFNGKSSEYWRTSIFGGRSNAGCATPIILVMIGFMMEFIPDLFDKNNNAHSQQQLVKVQAQQPFEHSAKITDEYSMLGRITDPLNGSEKEKKAATLQKLDKYQVATDLSLKDFKKFTLNN